MAKVNNKEKPFLTPKILCVLLVISVLAILMFFLKNNEVVKIFYTGSCTIGAALIAVWGVSNTINSNQELKNKELLNELDQKSEWRKELMNIASKTFLTTDDIYRVLASLRYLPKRPIEMEKETENKTFNTISNYIYFRLKEILIDISEKIEFEKSGDSSKEKLTVYLNSKYTEEIRLYILFLLKHHWEYNKSKKDKQNFKKIEENEFEKVKQRIRTLKTCDNLKEYYDIETEINDIEKTLNQTRALKNNSSLI
ncbi:hypothetical protein [Staphylococcus borealis]|uniref:hypothetical protein n=1 Tax=Staphylococcus borealis TaxID=2742203 RepID=UPI000D1FC586|nr:hypothetical protein [Staphylococcus borealis]PTK65952.1 hypothetical protein BUZ28_09535 [Staphylococcus borealis]RIO71078.1 hypothetical protein BUZ17_04620 [Staphylococcus borealis]